MSEVRTYRAASMHEALAIVRKEVGADAVILHTRHVTQRRLIPFLRGRDQVEVTVGVGVNVRSHAASVPSPSNLPPSSSSTGNSVSSVMSAAHEATNSGVGSRLDAIIDDAPAAESPATLSPVSRAAQLAAELERRNAEKARLEQSLSNLESVSQSRLPTSVVEPEQLDGSDDEQSAETTDNAEPPRNQAAVLAAAAQSIRDAEAGSSVEVAAKLDTLQRMMENLTRASQFRGAEEIPTELFDVYTHLIDADIEDDLARELIFGLRKDCSPEQLHDPDACRALLSARVESEVRIADPIRPANGRRRIVALVGPTGVGKTTTIAKLAANFRLRDGIRMGLVTVDTYRIAAVEQLRTYAEIIDLPMKVVTSPQEMRRALDELADLDLVLIDTAGRSPRDELKIQELKQMLGEASIDEVHLVMSLTASVRSIKMTCEQFRPVNPTALILTKLDEAAGMGSLVSVSREVSLPFSYLTTGQDVPEDIEPANASRIARLVLGQDRLFD
ncbi:flagellar biosynthesis protein FlhF [bacterium]|nr:flagellar biosynthesis protein FlhF [bacterium]